MKQFATWYEFRLCERKGSGPIMRLECMRSLIFNNPRVVNGPGIVNKFISHPGEKISKCKWVLGLNSVQEPFFGMNLNTVQELFFR